MREKKNRERDVSHDSLRQRELAKQEIKEQEQTPKRVGGRRKGQGEKYFATDPHEEILKKTMAGKFSDIIYVFASAMKIIMANNEPTDSNVEKGMETIQSFVRETIKGKKWANFIRLHEMFLYLDEQWKNKKGIGDNLRYSLMSINDLLYATHEHTGRKIDRGSIRKVFRLRYANFEITDNELYRIMKNLGLPKKPGPALLAAALAERARLIEALESHL